MNKEKFEIISDDLVDADSISNTLQKSIQHICSECGSENSKRTFFVENQYSRERIKAFDQNQLGKKSGILYLSIGIAFFILLLSLIFFLKIDTMFLYYSIFCFYMMKKGIYAITGASQLKDGNLIEVYTCKKCQHTWEIK
jgi:DNA-directed RNA polymerase subunit M/transcription elongation factor TFIIS